MTTQAAAQPQTLAQRYPYLGLAVAILLMVGAAVIYERGRADESESGLSVVTLAGRPGSTPRLGEPAPDFTLATLDGQRLGLADLRGRPVLINFWASWCPPCRGEMPDLAQAAREYSDVGLVVLAVNLQEEPEAIQRYATNAGLSFPIALDRSGAVATRYNLTGLPTSFFIDRNGVVRDLNIGALTLKGLRGKLARLD